MEEVHFVEVAAEKDKNPDSSHDETQDMKVDFAHRRLPKLDAIAGKRGYNYVKPVIKG